MKEVKERIYPKIGSLYLFDNTIKKYLPDVYANKSVELLKDYQWYFTEKVDGTNLRLVWDGYNLTYGGRTLNANLNNKKRKEYVESNLVNKDIETILEQLFKEKEVVIYGELFGGDVGIANYSNEYQFRVFDIWVDGYWLEYKNIVEIANNLSFNVVPIVLNGTIEDGVNFVKNINKSELSETGVFEGIVGKPIGDFYDRNGERIIVKIKKTHFKKMKE